MAVTIFDVAEHIGVSIKTVSRVINQEPNVAAATRTKVLAAVESLGYVPNLAARELASQRSFTIGLLLGRALGEYLSQITQKILELSTQKGYTVLIANYTPFAEPSRRALDDLIRRKSVAGLIVTPPCDNDSVLLERLQAANLPFVRLTPANLDLPLPYVAADDHYGAYRMTAYLLALGHRRIGFIAGDAHYHASLERFEGYRAALQEHQIPFEPALVRTGHFTFMGGVQAGKELLSCVPAPTAIFASNDESAAGALTAAHTLGYKVPEALSIVGFDDFPLAQKTWPALTTVCQPMDEISSLATQMLLALIEQQAPEQLRVRVPTSLVVRASSGVMLS